MTNAADNTRVQTGWGTKALSVLVAVLMLGVWGAAGTPTVADAATPPDPPTGLTPNGTTVTGNPLLSWDATPGATSYKVLVKTSPGGATVSGANNQTVYSNNFAFVTDLALGDYTWTVTAVSAGGSSTASAGTFTKAQVDGPVLVSPADGATINYPSQNPTFTWQAVTGVKTYKLEVSTDAAFSPAGTTTYTTQATSFTPTTTQAFGQTYYWRVTGTFSTTSVNTGTSDVRSYQINWGSGGLMAPTPLAPSNSATDTVHDVVLKWTPVAGAATYQVQVSPNQDWTNNKSFDIVTDSTLYAPAESLDNGNYFWRVRATTSEGSQSEWSPIWQFRRVPMQQVTLASPANSSGYPTQLRDLFLSWNPVPEASAYQLEISADPNFSVVTTAQTCITNHTSWAPYTNESGVGAQSVPGPGGSSACPLDRTDLSALFALASDNVTVYWRVRGLDYFASTEQPDPWNNSRTPINGPWSDVWRFQYHADLGVPTLSSPANGVSLAIPRLSWTAVPGTKYYTVTIAEYVSVADKDHNCAPKGGSPSVYSYKTAATSFVPSLKKKDQLPPTVDQCASTYQWTVNATNGVGHTGPTPPMRSFVLSGLEPRTATSVITPTATQVAGYPGAVSFTWNGITNADHYEVRWFAAGGLIYTLLGNDNRGQGNDDYFPYTAAFTTTTVQPAGDASYQIAAIDSANNEIATSALIPISVQWPTTVQQTGPTNCVPSNAQCSTEPSTPLLQWAQVPGASTYRVIIANDSGFTNKVRQYLTSGIEMRSVEALPDNQAGQAYYWFVQACRGDWKTSALICGPNETAPGASVWAFQKRSPAIAGAHTLQPTSPTPVADDACGAAGVATVDNQPTFCWDGYGGVPGNDVAAMTYHIQVARDSTFSNASLVDDYEVDQASYTPYRSGSIPTAIKHRTYPDGPLYWRVQARDATGNYLTWSPVQSITKRTPAVVLTSPSNGANVSASPSLVWAAQTFAAKYTVEVYKNGDTNWSSANLVRTQTTDLTAYTATQGGNAFQSLPAGTYAWRVRAVDANNLAGGWSTGRTFNVVPGAPTLLTPTSGQSISSPTVLYTWSSVPGAVSYRIQTSVNSNLASPFENKVTYGTSWAPQATIPSTTIYWTVSALDAQGQVLGTSAASSFNYTSARPTAAKPNGVTGDAQVALSWTASRVALVGPITQYVITAYIGNTVNKTVTVAAATAGPESGATATVTGLVNNTGYTFTVTPYDSNGPGVESPKSATLTPQQWAPFSSANNCVKRLYADMLGVNSPTPAQMQVFTNYISQGHSCADVAFFMWNMGPFQDLFGISRLYQAYFLRIPDYGGINYWTGLHRTNGLSLSSMSSYFAQSQEFIGTYGHLTNAGFMTLIYNNVLHRAPDQGGYQYWLGMLNQNRIGRGDVMLLFSESAEYETVQMPTMKADLLILEFLRRTPTQAEVDALAPLMPYRGESQSQKSQMDAELLTQIKAIMATAEYKARAN